MSNPVLAIPDNGQVVQFTNLEVGDNGTVHLSCFMGDVSTGDGFAVYTNSTDGGKTWSQVKQIGPCRSKSPNPQETKEIHQRENSAVSLATSGNNVYMTWTHQTNGEQRGFYAFSNDDGANWSQPIEFGLEVSTDDYYHFFSNISASADQATISWYEVDKSTSISNYKMVEIFDDGMTFGKPAVVSTASTNFSSAPNDPSKFYGDYNSSVKDGCFTYSVWSEGTDIPTIYVTKFNGCSLTDIEEVTPVNSDLSASMTYPNPVDKMITIEIDARREFSNIQFDLISADGRILKRMGSVNIASGYEKISFNAEELTSGKYMLRILLEDGMLLTRSFIKE